MKCIRVYEFQYGSHINLILFFHFSKLFWNFLWSVIKMSSIVYIFSGNHHTYPVHQNKMLLLTYFILIKNSIFLFYLFSPPWKQAPLVCIFCNTLQSIFLKLVKMSVWRVLIVNNNDNWPRSMMNPLLNPVMWQGQGLIFLLIFFQCEQNNIE